MTDPIAYTSALAAAAQEHGASLVPAFRLSSVEEDGGGLLLASAAGDRHRCEVLVNCAGLFAGEVARLCGDSSFEIYPRKGEFLVFELAPPPIGGDTAPRAHQADQGGPRLPEH